MVNTQYLIQQQTVQTIAHEPVTFNYTEQEDSAYTAILQIKCFTYFCFYSHKAYLMIYLNFYKCLHL